MTDLSTIDFSKLKLPDWQVRGLCAESNHGRVFMRTQAGCTVAARDVNGQWSVTHQDATFAELRALESICAQVDSFIVSEQKRLEEEKLPPWRECTREEAEANPGVSEYMYDNNQHWKTMLVHVGDGPRSFYRYRTRAPKPVPNLPKVRAPEGREWAQVTGYGTCLVTKGYSVGETYCVEAVPKNKDRRDAMLACVAVYDAERGEAPTVVVSSIRHERINCVTMPPSLSGELGGVTDSDADKLFSRRFLLVEVEP